MHTHMAIFCSIEPLWPYSNENDWLVGLNISVAIVPGDGNDPRSLQKLASWKDRIPWRWNPIAAAYYLIDSSQPTACPDGVERLGQRVQVEEPVPDLGMLGAERIFEAVYQKTVIDNPDFIDPTNPRYYNPLLYNPDKADDLPTYQDPDYPNDPTKRRTVSDRRFYAWLADLSTRPAVVQQNLNLSRLVSLKGIASGQDSTKYLYLVPELSGVPGFDKLGPPSRFVPPCGGHGAAMWTYASTDDCVIAYSQPFLISPWKPPDPSNVKSLIDPSTYWIRATDAPQLEADPGALTNLAQQLEDSFNLPSLIESAFKAQTTLAPDDLADWRNAFYASLRDRVLSGDRASFLGNPMSTDAYKIKEEILDAIRGSWPATPAGYGRPTPQKVREMIDVAISNWNETLSGNTWRDKVLYPVAQQFFIPAVNLTDQAALDAEMNKWLSLLKTEEGVRALLSAQWAAAALAIDGIQSQTLARLLPPASQAQAFGIYFRDLKAPIPGGEKYSDGSYYLEINDTALKLEVKYCLQEVLFLLYSGDSIQALGRATNSRNFSVFMEFEAPEDTTIALSKLWYRTDSDPQWKRPYDVPPLQLSTPVNITVDSGDFAKRNFTNGEVRAVSAVASRWNDFWPVTQFWTAAQSNVQKSWTDQQTETLRDPLRSRLAAASVQWAYRALQVAGNTDPLDALCQALKTEREDYIMGRLGRKPDSKYAKLLPLVDSDSGRPVADALIVSVPPCDIVAPAQLPASGPMPLVVDMLLTSIADTKSNSYDPDDYMRRFSGVGVLMRVQKSRNKQAEDYYPWRCLNMAQIQIGVTDSKMETKTLQSVGPVPYRISYNDGLKQAIVMYNVQPLVAPSHLAALGNPNDDLSGEQEFIPPTGPMKDLSPAIRYSPFLVKDEHGSATAFREWGILPPLKYGRKIQILAFVIANSGALPSRLSEGPNQPCRLRPYGSLGDLTREFHDYGHMFPYMRKVPVRAPRLIQPSGAENRLPLLPDDARSKDVVLLDSELQRDALRGESARNVYFGPEAPTPGRTGLLNLPAAGWRIWLESVEHRSDAASQQYVVEISGQQKGADAVQISIQVRRSGSVIEVVATVSGRKTTRLFQQSDRYYDLEIRQTAGTLTVLLTPAAGLFLLRQPDAVQTLEILKPGQGIFNATVSVTGLTNGLLRYRRPQVEFTTDASSGPPPAALAEPAPTALLGPWMDSLDFQLSPPDIDLQTWDRWTDFTNEKKHLKRAEIWTNWYLQSRNPDTNGRVRSIDEPAVEGYLIEMVPIHSRFQKDAPVRMQWYDKRKLFFYDEQNVSDYWAQVESPPVPIFVRSSGPTAGSRSQSFGLKLDRDSRGVDLGEQRFQYTMDPGGVYELRVYAGVPLVEFDSGSGNGRFSLGSKTSLRTHGNCALFPPFRLRFEVALHPDDLLNEKPLANAPSGAVEALRGMLLKAIQPEFIGQAQVVTVNLIKQLSYSLDDLPGFLIEHWWPYMRDVQMLMREWRWLGRPERPSSAFPYEKFDSDGLTSYPPDDSIVNWEAGAFANRELDDIRRETTRIGCYANELKMFSEDRTGQHQTLYHQFAVLVYGRYSSRLKQFPQTYVESQPSGWIRQFVKCRYLLPQPGATTNPEVPAPAVRMVIPLTQSSEWADGNLGSDQRWPGVLVVMDEEWGAAGGFAEKLGVELVNTCHDEEEIRYFDEMQEFAPDPIRSAEAWDPSKSWILFKPEDIEGPIGHTFDPPSEKPLYRGCSFLVRLPRDVEQEKPERPFARMRFYRYLDQRGCVDGPPGIEPGSYQSKRTDSFWTQFLPDSNVYQNLQGLLTVVEVLDAPNSRVISVPKLRFFETEPNRFFQFNINLERCGLVAAVTRRITDAFGRKNQELFVGMFRLDADDRTLFHAIAPCPGPFDKTDELVVRLIETWVVPKRRDVIGEETQEFHAFFNLSPRDFSPAITDSVLDGCRADALEQMLLTSRPLPVVGPRKGEGRK